ncbi:MAG: YicC/YloC family endoribonuclease [Candidatus Eisenbacteria bacterium]|nr:YicC/YloC family endoribonuclease [Candidatus Eisenbacteria bacterium]
MIRSMTGFGRAELEDGDNKLVAEVRSINHRFCEISIRLPKALSTLELDVRRLIQERISRGKITVSVAWNGDGESLAFLEINTELAEKYYTLLKTLKEKFDLSGDIDTRTLAGFPDLLVWKAVEVPEERAKALVSDVVSKALDGLVAMKEAEGTELRRDLDERVAKIVKIVLEIEERAPLKVSEARNRLKEKLSQLLEESEIPEERLSFEIAILAERLDSTEECVRLRSHAQQMAEFLHRSQEPAGRKLNFLVQEMGREANTISSKANDIEIVRNVLLIKEELEKIREQIQNVE